MGGGNGMQLETTRFGPIEVESDAEITFTQPIIGFQDFRRFVVLPGPENSALKWLQSTESGELAFILIDPTTIISDYAVSLGASELTELAASGVADLDVYTLLVVPQDRMQIRTNLKAPIVINPKSRLGKQTILDKSDYPVRHFINQPQPGKGTSQEAPNAGTNA